MHLKLLYTRYLHKSSVNIFYLCSNMVQLKLELHINALQAAALQKLFLIRTPLNSECVQLS